MKLLTKTLLATIGTVLFLAFAGSTSSSAYMSSDNLAELLEADGYPEVAWTGRGVVTPVSPASVQRVAVFSEIRNLLPGLSERSSHAGYGSMAQAELQGHAGQTPAAGKFALPESATMLLFGSGMLGLASIQRRKMKK